MARIFVGLLTTSLVLAPIFLPVLGEYREKVASKKNHVYDNPVPHKSSFPFNQNRENDDDADDYAAGNIENNGNDQDNQEEAAAIDEEATGREKKGGEKKVQPSRFKKFKNEMGKGFKVVKSAFRDGYDHLFGSKGKANGKTKGKSTEKSMGNRSRTRHAPAKKSRHGTTPVSRKPVIRKAPRVPQKNRPNQAG